MSQEQIAKLERQLVNGKRNLERFKNQGRENDFELAQMVVNDVQEELDYLKNRGF